MTDVFQRNYHLRQKLATLLSESVAPLARSQPIDILITPNEVNDRHGTGPLLKRVLAGRKNLLCIRSRDEWGGHDFGDWNVRLTQASSTRDEGFANVLRVLHGCMVGDVLCVPYKHEELLTALAVKEIFGARLCVYLMDDQNVTVNAVPDALMREVLQKASLRFATHPELRDAYVEKYGFPFYLLPAIVPSDLILTPPDADSLAAQVSGSGALLGSFWDQVWFDRLCNALQGSRRRIRWYGNNRSPWLCFDPEKLSSAGIEAMGVIPEPQLVAELRRQPFVVVPAGTLTVDEQNRGVASLSLPGRIPFTAATAGTPILLVGNDKSCGARFVRHFGIGHVVPYEAHALNTAMEQLSDPKFQQTARANAARIARAFSDEGVPAWFEESCRRMEPADLRFETVFQDYPRHGS